MEAGRTVPGRPVRPSPGGCPGQRKTVSLGIADDSSGTSRFANSWAGIRRHTLRIFIYDHGTWRRRMLYAPDDCFGCAARRY